MTSKAFNNATDANRQQGGRRNLIINGAMQVAQRGTSSTGQTSTGYLALDRWRTEPSGATYNVSQQAMSSADLEATGFANFLRMEVTTGNNNAGVAQKIEASSIRQFKGQKLTASFYAKGTNPNGGSFTLTRFFYDGSNFSTLEHTSFSITSTWQKYTFTFDYPSEGSTDLTTASAYMNLSFLQPVGDTSTNAWTLDITGVQLEVGTVATPFEHRSYGEELALCQRYYETSYDDGVAPGTANGAGTIGGRQSGGNYVGHIFFKQKKRSQPSMEYYSYETGTAAKARNVDAITDVSCSSLTAGQYGNTFVADGADANWIRVHFIADAEL